MKIAENQSYSFLLESVERAETIGKYSFLGVNPSILFVQKGKQVSIIRNGIEEKKVSEDPLKEFALTYAAIPAGCYGRLCPPSWRSCRYMSYDQCAFLKNSTIYI